jgi:hypothetical protein
VVIIKFAWL